MATVKSHVDINVAVPEKTYATEIGAKTIVENGAWQMRAVDLVGECTRKQTVLNERSMQLLSDNGNGLQEPGTVVEFGYQMTAGQMQE